jgi:AsmA protein
VDAVISTIPSFNLSSSIKNGYFKYTGLPQAVNDISFTLNASCSDDNYHNTSLSIENLNARVLSNFIKGFVKMGGSGDYPLMHDYRRFCIWTILKSFTRLIALKLRGILILTLLQMEITILQKKYFLLRKLILNLLMALFKLHITRIL